jgi:hypothetical protein
MQKGYSWVEGGEQKEWDGKNIWRGEVDIEINVNSIFLIIYCKDDTG